MTALNHWTRDTGSFVTTCWAGGGDDDTRAKDGRGLCIIDGGYLIEDAEDAAGWVPYEVRDVSYAGGQPEDRIIQR